MQALTYIENLDLPSAKGAERRGNGAFRKQETGNGEADHAGIRAGGREADVLQLGKRPGGDEIPDMAHPYIGGGDIKGGGLLGGEEQRPRILSVGYRLEGDHGTHREHFRGDLARRGGRGPGGILYRKGMVASRDNDRMLFGGHSLSVPGSGGEPNLCPA